MINLTTGPVGILPAVMNAFSQAPISHRSEEFQKLYSNVTSAICNAVNVQQTYIMTGSGTLANEVMIGQIALRNEHGLILSNGEFGNRLKDQATRQQLDFEVLSIPNGQTFDVEVVRLVLREKSIKWILFCHCESSTGVVNDLDDITRSCRLMGCDVYVDCMSTFGATQLNLDRVVMATASSGKAIGSVAGLAIVLCNKDPIAGGKLPVYLDLYHYKCGGGIPFTLSSNLLAALAVAVQHNLNEHRWQQLDEYSCSIYNKLASLGIIPFATPGSRIFTIVPADGDAQAIGVRLAEVGIQLSCESSYLIKRNWMQLALFGNYSNDDVAHILQVLDEVCRQPGQRDKHNEVPSHSLVAEISG